MNKTLRAVDLLVTNGTVLTVNDRDERFAPGAVAIAGSEIVAVGPAAEVAAKVTAKRTLDVSGCVVAPGLVNAHTHAAMTIFRGLADDLPLMEWLQEHIFPAERGLSERWVYWGTLLACAEMIRSGTTAFSDMYLFEHKVAEAAKTAGIRALLGEAVFDFPTSDFSCTDNALAATRDFIREYRHDPLIRFSVIAHAAYTCGPDTLKRCQALAEAEDALLHIHLSENAHEVSEVRKRFGFRPVRHLHRLGLVTPRLLAAHCVELTPGEVRLFAENGVQVLHCPESNMKLASGAAPVPSLLHHGVPVALGTDGCASNNDLDMFGEMDTCAKLHKLVHRNAAVVPAPTVLRMGTANGAAAIGRKGELGTLQPGQLADLIVVDFRQPHLTPVYNAESHLVYSARGADVLHTIIHGRIVMENRRILTFDADQAMAEVAAIAREIRP